MAGKSRFKQGVYKCKNPQKYKGDPTGIVYRSLWELKFMKYCDLNEKILDWSAPRFIYNTKREESNIVESWDYEYALFELLHIYKTFDTEKYYLTWTGH